MRRRREPAVVWDAGTEAIICRDERCTLAGIHLVHEITDTRAVIRARQAIYGWVLDPLERPKRRRRGESTSADTAALDHTILCAVTPETIKSASRILVDVHNSFGSCSLRRLRRRLAYLRHRGDIVQMTFAGYSPLIGYTSPSSWLIKDPEAAEDVLWRALPEFVERDEREAA